ncbi:uncharacterized protein LOC136025027 isoform X2 [Artemia franciscana]|uniref:uncharacterized protein LOC136025027 isoform X2 n=1 Tax=Artemia franciscana TaxID=6661 RepID=UPI0032DB9804
MDNLPNDVLFLLMSWLDTNDFISLSYVCKRFQSLSYSPLLNRKLDFRSGVPSSTHFVEKFLQDKLRSKLVHDLSISSLFWIKSKALKTLLSKMTNLKVLDVHGTLLIQRDLKAVVDACPYLTHLSWTCNLRKDQQTEAMDLGKSLNQGTYGTETRAAAFCVLSIPPFNRHNENKEFMGKILSLCLHNNSEHVYLFQLLSHHTHLEQLRLTSRMQSSSNAPALLFFDHELLTNSLCRLTNIIALELTFSHSLWLEGMTHALKCLISLKRLRIVPCILVDKFKTVHSETEAVSFKRPRIERTLKEYSSLLKDLCENTPDLEVIEIIPSVHCCSICSNVELSFVCRDLAHLRNLRHLTLQNLVLYDASFFREVSMSCKKFESLTLKGIKATYTERFARHLLPVLPQLTALKHLVWDQGYAKNSSEVICALTKLSNLERVALIYNSRAVSSEKIGPVLELIQNNRKLEGLFCVFGKSSEKACKSCSKAINEYRKRSGRWNLFSLIQNKYLHNDCGGEYLDLMPFYLYQDWIVQPSKVVLQPDVMKV